MPNFAVLLCILGILCVSQGQELLKSNRPNVFGVDKLKLFYERIRQSDVKYCPDRTRLLPDCNVCIPGLQQNDGSSTCDSYIQSSESIRSEILTITKERYPDDLGSADRMPRPYGLYPYLEKGDFMVRQELFGRILTKSSAENIVDIGAYYNPIHLFLDSQSQGVENSNYCPNSVLIIEPILDALSVMIPCGNSGKSTHIIFMPITFRFYMKHVINRIALPRPDSVVCIGCDSHYGPNRNMLENTFARPFDLLLEYPSEYVHNGPMRKMSGNGPGESMLFHRTLEPNTKDTTFTKRSMKIIRYEPV
jgi:hypothetical protein